MAAQTTAMTGGSGLRRGVTTWPGRLRDYFDELKTEMKHVTWPSRVQVRATTAVVIVTVFLFAAYFAAVDLLLGRAINQIFQILAHR